MDILVYCKRFMSYGGLGTDKSMTIGKQHYIPRTIFRVVIIMTQIALGTAQFINCVNKYHDAGLQVMLYPLHCLVYNSTKLATYCAFIPKVNEITELMGHLHRVINQSMFAVTILFELKSNDDHFYFCIVKFYFTFHTKLGCNLSPASYAIYSKREKYDKRIVLLIVCLMGGLVVFSYTPSALCWLITIIFHVPWSEYWTVPLATDEA